MRDGLRHSHATVDVVEVDPTIPAVAREWFGFDPDRCPVHLADARAFLQSTERTWERVVFDAFLSAGGNSELNVFPDYFAEPAFIALVADRITPDGVLVANVNGALRGADSAPLLSLLDMIESVFGHIAVHSVADRTNDGVALSEHPDLTLADEHYIVIAARQPMPPHDEVVQRATSAGGSRFVDEEIATFARNRVDAWRGAV
jgi:spermidine synthase